MDVEDLARGFRSRNPRIWSGDDCSCTCPPVSPGSAPPPAPPGPPVPPPPPPSLIPVITSPATADGTVGAAFAYQVTATNNPTSFGASGLPAGLLINITTGLISGTPTTEGVATVDLSATNGDGTGVEVLTITIGLIAAQRLSAHGITGGGQNSYANPHTTGRYKKYYWRDIQPTSDLSFDFGDINSELSDAQLNNKQFVVLLNLNSGDPARGTAGLPAWLIGKGAVDYNYIDPHNGESLHLFLPWDPVFMTYALRFIDAFCAHCDGLITQVSMGGFGKTTETHMPEPSPDGKTVAECIPLWIDSASTLIGRYNAGLSQSTFTIAMGAPYNGATGTAALQSLIDIVLPLYGSKIGFENWGLNANSSNSFLPNKIIQDNSLTNPVGFQMTGNETTGGGGNLCGQGGPAPPCLRAAMEAGVALGAQYLQVFGDDVENPAYATDLDEVTVELLPPP